MEIEAKYTILDNATYETLSQLREIAGFRIVDGSPINFLDIYLDTEKSHILRAGYACRCRHLADAIHITLKGLNSSTGTIHRREERELVVKSGTECSPSGWPDGPFRERVLSLSLGHPLTAHLQLTQERFPRYLLDREGTPFAELSLDRFRIANYPAEQDFLELEIELRERGNESDLLQVVAALRDLRTVALTPQPLSKFERGIALAHPNGNAANILGFGNARLSDAIEIALRKILRPLFIKMQLHEVGTYQGGNLKELYDMSQAIHQMGIALDISDLYIGEKSLGTIAHNLHWAARILDAAHDIEMFQERVNSELARTHQGQTILTLLPQTWNRVYSEKQHRLSTYLRGQAYAELKQNLWSYLSIKVLQHSSPYTARDILPIVLRGQLARVCAEADRMNREQDQLSSAYDTMRTHLQHLHGALTFFQNDLVPEAQEAIKALEQLLSHLGELQRAQRVFSHLRAIIQSGSWEHAQQPQTLWRKEVKVESPQLEDLLTTEAARINTLIAEARGIWVDTWEKCAYPSTKRVLASLTQRTTQRFN